MKLQFKPFTLVEKKSKGKKRVLYEINKYRLGNEGYMFTNCCHNVYIDKPHFQQSYSPLSFEEEPVYFQGRKMLIGADPEVFVHCKSRNQIVPAWLTGIKGTKKEPQPLPSGGAVQIDGCALEFNIQPVSTYKEFNENINNAISDIEAMIPSNFELVFDKCTHRFDKRLFDEQPDDHKRLGCEPDFNAETGLVNQIASSAHEDTFRTTGGHIHIGYTEGRDVNDPRHFYDARVMTQILSQGLMIYIGKRHEELLRESLYGGGYAFRPKPYGTELRYPSNLWLKEEKRKKIFWSFLHVLDNNPLESNLIPN